MVSIWKTETSRDIIKRPNVFGVRHVQALLLFFGVCFGYLLRVNLSAAIVPMTTQSTSGQPYYDWNSSTKALILSSFFWGYTLAQLPASLLAKRFGGKLILGISTVIAALTNIFIPLSLYKGNWIILCGFRVLVGLTQGTVYPCIHTILAKWVPSSERGFMSTLVYSGALLGTALVLATSGSVFESTMGWPGIFYISGGICLIWSAVFLKFGADTPRDTSIISEAELKYIESSSGSDQQSKSMLVPWKSLFSSSAFYGLIAAHCGALWGFYTLLTELPTYLSKVLHLDVKANALLSSLPYFVMWLLSLIVSPIADALINRNITSVITSRKLFNSIGQWIPMICLIALGYMTENETALALTLLTIGVGFTAAPMCGYLINHMDLSPNFAGPMMGITNGIANLLSIAAPLVVGAIVHNEENPEEWRIIFFITAGIYLLCNGLFLIFGKATVQPWNEGNFTSSSAVLPNNSGHVSVNSLQYYTKEEVL